MHNVKWGSLSSEFFRENWGVEPKIQVGGFPPKRMVKIMEHPIKMDDLGGTPLFWVQHPFGFSICSDQKHSLGPRPPAQDSSHLQDYEPFLVGDSYKPSFATVTGRGDNPKHSFVSTQLYI